MNEPDKITAGYYYTWTESNSTYPATSGYTIKYDLFNSARQFSITSVADGADHKIELLSSITDDYIAGTYKWKSYALKAGEKYPIAEGILEIEALTSAAADYRTHNQIMLDKIETALESIGDNAHTTLTINGKSVTYNREELLKVRALYAHAVEAEENKDKIKAGKPTGGRILTRFK